MKKTKTIKKSVTCMALAALITAMGVTPMTVSAGVTPANKQVSTDTLGVTNVQTRINIPSAHKEITLNETGTYQLKASISSQAKKLGFELAGNQLKITYADQRVEYFPLEWKTSDSSKVKVSKNGKIVGVAVSDKDVSGEYIATKVTYSIPDGVTFVDSTDNTIVRLFKDGEVFTQDVVVVPTEDLNVYYQGVWSEDFADNDAKHTKDFAVRESNLEAQLKKMAESVTGHCVGTSSKVIAYTKTNDGTVRAYITTYNEKAGNHYYVVTYSLNGDAESSLTITNRDYCEKQYSTSGAYVRGQN